MKTYFECWVQVAAALFSQALAGEPELSEALPKPLGADAFGWAATLSGDVHGRFAVVLDGKVLETPLVGEGADQKAGWEELLREAASAAAGDLLASTGKKCQVASFAAITGKRTWTTYLGRLDRGIHPPSWYRGTCGRAGCCLRSQIRDAGFADPGFVESGPFRRPEVRAGVEPGP